jgi:hypothetical protein
MTLMHLAKKSDRGWIVRCDCDDKAEFRVRMLGIAVECPHCGRTALTADLTTEYWSRPPAPPRAPMTGAIPAE